MGNHIVHAQVPNLNVPPITAPVPPPNQSIKSSETVPDLPTSSTAEGDGKLTNPGTFEELHRGFKEIMPAPFDGFRLAINKGLSNHFQVGHTLNMSSSPQGTSYHFSSTYVGGSQTSPTDAYPVILGDIDNTGSLQAQMIHQLTKRMKGKCVVQTQQREFAMIQMDADYRGDDFTAACTLANIDVLNDSGVCVAHYLQKLTKRLDMGAECLYHYGQGKQTANLSLAGKYAGDNWVAAAQVNAGGWHASYSHKANDNISAGVDYEYSSHQDESAVTFGYQVDIPKANVNVRGMVDTNWTVGAVFEKRLHPLPFTFCLSGMINHDKNQSRFGFALQIG